MEYRYMVFNEVMNCFQFPNICETTEKGAVTCLFNTIGNDARKWRFVIKKVEKEEAYRIRQEMKYQNKARRLREQFLCSFTQDECLQLILLEERRRKGNVS